MTPAMVLSLLAAVGGRFTSDEAYRFCDYHLTDADDALLEQVVRMSDLSRWEAELILGDLGYKGDVDALLSRRKRAQVAANPQATNAKTRGRTVKAPHVVIGVLTGVLAVVGVALGGVLIGGVILIVLALALVGVALSGRSKADKYPDARSDYSRRV